MTDPGPINAAQPSDAAGATSEGLMRGSLGFLGGLVLCGVALAAQAALLQAIAGKKAN